MNVLPGRFDDDHAVGAMTAENGGVVPDALWGKSAGLIGLRS